MLKCADCGSYNIIEVQTLQAYFREGDVIRLRTITLEDGGNDGFVAKCSELLPYGGAWGDTEINAIMALGEEIKGRIHADLLGKRFDDEE